MKSEASASRLEELVLRCVSWSGVRREDQTSLGAVSHDTSKAKSGNLNRDEDIALQEVRFGLFENRELHFLPGDNDIFSLRFGKAARLGKGEARQAFLQPPL